MLLYELIKIANGESKFTKSTIIRWYILLFFTASSFGIGIALAFLFPFLVWILVEKKELSLKIIVSILPVIFAIIIIFLSRVHIYAFLTDNPQALNEYRNQYNFMEPHYWLSVAILFGIFIVYNIYMMFAFPLDYIIPFQYDNIISIIIIVVFLFCFLWLFAKTSSHKRRYYFTFSCLVTAIYAILSIGRAWTSMVFNLSLSSTAMTPRYHYSAFLMIIVLLCLMISDVKSIYSFKLRFIQGILFIALLLCLYPSWRKGPHVDGFVNTAEKERLLYYSTISDIENEVEKHSEGATVFLDNTIKDHFSIFMPSDTDFPDKAAVFIIHYPTNIVKGRKVYFIEKNPVIVEKVRKKNWRIAKLLVTQEEVIAGKIPQ